MRSVFVPALGTNQHPLEPRLLHVLTLCARLAAWAVMLLGIAVLVNWVYGNAWQLFAFDGMSLMRPWAALCLVLLGLCILLFERELQVATTPTLHVIPAAAVLVIGIITIAEYAANSATTPFDLLLFPEAVARTQGAYPGRMSGMTATIFVVLSLALLIGKSRFVVAHQQLAAVAALLSWMAVVGYLFGATTLYQSALFGAIAFQTAVATLILSLATLAAQPGRGVMLFSLARSSSRKTVLQFWLASVLAVLLLGWLAHWGQNSRQVDAALAIALLTGGAIVVLTVLISWSGVALQELEFQRHKAWVRLAKEQQRLGHLYGITSQLATSVSAEDVAHVVLTRAQSALGATGGSLMLVADGGKVFVADVVGYEPAIRAKWKGTTIPVDESSVATALAQRRMTFVESPDAASRQFPRLVDAQSGFKCWAAVPLVINEQCVGALDLAFSEQRTFDDEDKAFLQILGEQCAQALSRAKLYDSERKASQTNALLANASQVLAGSMTSAEKLEALAKLVVPALADWCTVNLNDGDGNIRLAALAHADPAKVPWLRKWVDDHPINSNPSTAISEVIHSGRTRLYTTMGEAEYAALSAGNESVYQYWRDSGTISMMAVPLTARNNTFGALRLASTRHDRIYGPDDVALAEEIAQRASIVIENARLFESEQKLNLGLRRAVAQLKRDEHIQRILARAGDLLISPLDEAARLQGAVQLVVGQLADWCTIELFSDDGALIQPAYAHADPALQQTLEELHRDYPPDVEARLSIGHVLRTGKPALIHQTDNAFVREVARDERHITLLTRLGVSSVMNVPLVARGRILGTISFVRGAASLPYTDQDLSVAMDLAARVGLALENARLYEHSRRLNLQLEQRVAARTAQLEFSNAKLRESREQLRELSGRTLALVEEERTRIAREVHDELGQALTSIKMSLAMTRKRLTADPKFADQAIGSAIETADDTIKSVRRIATELRPGVLDDLGLHAAIEWQLAEFERRTGIHCRFVSEVANAAIDSRVSTAVFRILQEALTNVARHSQASEVYVTLETDDEQLSMRVRDNGIGMHTSADAQPGPATSKTFGLLGMRERAFQLNGLVDFVSAPDKGTTVSVRIPLEHFGQDEIRGVQQEAQS